MYKKGIVSLLIVTILLSSIATFTIVKASTAGPDSFGYTYVDSNEITGPTYNWVEISNTGTAILPSSDDSYVSSIPMGFFFNFYGTDYSQVSISNNGILFTNIGSGVYTNQPITQSGIHGFIAPFWDDIVTWNSAGDIYYQTLGTEPHRTFVVEWQDNQHYSSSPSGITFEAIMYEGTNDILFQYQDTDFGQAGNDNGGSATVGIENPDGDIGLQYSYNQAVLSSNLAILFEFPAFQGTNMYLTMRGPTSMDQGHTMTYTISYNNFGGDTAADVEMQSVLSPDVVFVSSANQDPAVDQGTYDPLTHTVTWNLVSLQAFPNGRGSASVTVNIPETTPVGTVLTSSTTLSTTTLETRYDDNTGSVSTRVTGTNLPPNVDVEPLNGNSGDTPVVYWSNPITFTYTDPAATSVDIRIHINDGGADIVSAMNGPAPTWTYTVTFYPRHGEATITYYPHYPAQPDRVVQFSIYIDPAGYIYNAITNQRIEGATVWLQRPDGVGGWENVPIDQTPEVMQPDTNPLITNVNGQYEWLTLAGTYRVHVEATGYQPADSIAVTVPPPVFDLNVGLTPIPGTDFTAPVTTLTVGNPKVDVDGTTFINSNTRLALSAVDADTGVAQTTYEISNATHNTGQITYSQPFYLSNLADGTYTITYSSTDNAANTEVPLTTTLVLDNTAPQTTNDYDNIWHTSDFTVNLAATDSGCGVDTTYYKINNGATQNVAIDGQPIITTEAASNQIDYWSADKLGNQETPNTVAAIKLDKTTPTVAIGINDVANYTNKIVVTLQVNATDSISGISQVRYSNDGVWDTEAWANYTANTNWTLTSGDGAKTSYVAVKDNAGLITICNASIVLDTTAPIANAGVSRTITTGDNIILNGNGSTDSSGIVSYTWSFGDGENGSGSSVSHTYNKLGKLTIQLTVKDAAGNTGSTSIYVYVFRQPTTRTSWGNAPTATAQPTQNPTITPTPAPTTTTTESPSPTPTSNTAAPTETPLWLIISLVAGIFAAIIIVVTIVIRKNKK